MDNTTAKVSCFARAYHYRNNDTWVFADPFAERLLTDEEYSAISQNMSLGISFFAPEFQGTSEEALRFIVDRQLAPSVLARSAFCERAIDNAVRIGCDLSQPSWKDKLMHKGFDYPLAEGGAESRRSRELAASP